MRQRLPWVGVSGGSGCLARVSGHATWVGVSGHARDYPGSGCLAQRRFRCRSPCPPAAPASLPLVVIMGPSSSMPRMALQLTTEVAKTTAIDARSANATFSREPTLRQTIVRRLLLISVAPALSSSVRHRGKSARSQRRVDAAPYGAHWFEPSQVVPAHSAAPPTEQSSPLRQLPVPQAAALQQPPAHSRSGSVSTVTCAQVPSTPPVLAAVQAKQRLPQAALQHTLSEQMLFRQSPPLLQGSPCSPLQAPLPLQAPGLHSLSGSVFCVMLPQVPVAKPVLALVQAVHPRLHWVLQQTLSAAGQELFKQSPGALQGSPCSPLHTPPSQAPGLHSLSGSVLLLMLAQVPSTEPVLALLHAMQVEPQALLQQNPSMHWLPVHSLERVHVCPTAFFDWQTPPPSHQWVESQSASPAFKQSVKHALGPQT